MASQTINLIDEMLELAAQAIEQIDSGDSAEETIQEILTLSSYEHRIRTESREP